jgi:cellulose synthase/poly-beta-1,6-N-acetylglucosamine synthase-like glycosyltransferase
MSDALEVVFWVAVALIVWTQLGYAAVLWLIVGSSRREQLPRLEQGAAGAEQAAPSVSLIVAAHNEQEVISAKVADAFALAYPRAQMEVIVACDGCTDATAQRARDAGADLVLDLPRGGKVRAQDLAVARARGSIMAFSDANAAWERHALLALVSAFADPRVGYACGQVRYAEARAVASDAAGAASQEDLYWRYELALRSLESRLRSITGGNGGIYATRREAYMVVDPIMGHDLSFPFNMVKRGWRAVYVPSAVASEKMVPSIEGEFARKRRMMSHTWPIVVQGGMLSPRGYGIVYSLMILSHRALRYATPALHLVLLAASAVLVAEGAGPVYTVALFLQVAVIVASLLGERVHLRPLLVARHYVLSTAAVAAGLWDWLRHGTSAGWQAAEGTR